MEKCLNLPIAGFVLSVFLITPGKMIPQTSFEKHTVCTDFNQGTEVHACDLNQDGFIDFLSSGANQGGQVTWWENNGYFDFIEHLVDSDLDWARSVGAGDLNNNGAIDIVAAGWGANTVRWYENDGEENWTPHDIDTQFIGAHTVDIKDVNNDGRLDVLCSSFDNTTEFSEIAWWENMPDTSWTKHVISVRFQQSPFIYGEDIDGDGDMDILACGELNGEVYWWENDGSQNWTEHMIDDDFSMAHTVHARDIDLDGDMDIIGAACMSSRLAWWENDGNENFTKHSMGMLTGALWFDAVDLDNDGDRDLYAGGQGASYLVWWQNDGNCNFARQNIDGTFTQTFSVVHADFNNDSDTDLVAIGYNSAEIAWFDNQLFGPELFNTPEGIVYDSLYDRYLVSNVTEGSIVITDTGNNAQSYFTYGYDKMYGMCIIDDVVYSSDGDTIFGFSLETAEEVFALRVPSYNSLDGMTTDGNGYLYVIDTGGRMMKINIDSATYQVLVPYGLPDYPQDCVYDPYNDRIIVAAFVLSAAIVSVDPETGEITTLLDSSPGRYDGVTTDQDGNFYFASYVGGGRVYRYNNDFSGPYEIVATGLGQPTGLIFNQLDNILAVPSFNHNEVYYFEITTVGLNEAIPYGGVHMELFPNPTNGKFRLILQGQGVGIKCTLAIHDMTGRVIREDPVHLSAQGDLAIDLGHQRPGPYLASITIGSRIISRKVLVIE